MAEIPSGEAMSREGKGTDAASEAGRSRPLSWSDVERRLTGGGWFWLATVRPNGAPHVMPLFAAWAGTSFFYREQGSGSQEPQPGGRTSLRDHRRHRRSARDR
jgi:hypothetical protein